MADLTKQLEELENADGDSALDLAEEIAGTQNGLEQLVERFAGTSNIAVARAVAFLLAQNANHPTEDSCNLVYEFVGKLAAKNDDSTLMNALTAIQRQVIGECAWQGAVPVELFPFVAYCLERSDVVKDNALRVLAAIDESGLAPFSPEQLTTLSARR